MRQQVVVYWNEGLDFNLHADPAEPMTPDQAQAWLDAQFTAMECEPLRALAATGAPAAAPLLELMRTGDPLQKRYAMEGLGRMGPAAAAAPPTAGWFR